MIRITLSTERLQELNASMERLRESSAAMTENMGEWYAEYLRGQGYTDSEIKDIIVGLVNEIVNPPTE